MVALDRCKAVESFDCYDPENLERVAELCRGAAMVIEERPYAGWPAHQPIAAKILAAEPDLTAICISPFGLSGPQRPLCRCTTQYLPQRRPRATDSL